MAYALSVRAVTGKTTLYARITDKESGLMWNQTGSAWAANPGEDANIALTEDGAYKGYYAASAGITPVPGGIYKISVFDSSVTDYEFSTIENYSSRTKTVLEIINAVQLELGMPQSAAITDSLAKIILAKMNTVLLTLIPAEGILDHLKVEGSFTIHEGLDYVRFSPANVPGIDKILRLKKSNLNPLTIIDSQKLKEIKEALEQTVGFEAEPEYARISGRDGGLPLLELSCKPDATYTVNYEAMKSAKELVATAPTEFVPLSEAVRAGALMLMKIHQGRDSAVEAAAFSAAIGRATTVGSSGIDGDFQV